MNDRDDQYSDRESILMALDQLSQTIDVMTSVVGRLRSHVEAHVEAQERVETKADRDQGGAQGKKPLTTGSATDRILH
jgi:phage gpG-like protein